MNRPNRIEQPETLSGYEKRWIGLIFLGIATLVISLASTLINVAIPSISRDLGANTSDLQWIVDTYMLTFASLLLTMGTLSDRFGRKLALQIGLLWFSLGSILSAVASSATMLMATQAFTGIGGAIIMPATLSIITASFPQRERAQAIALWAAVFGLGSGIGPLVGGLLLEHFGWNAVFLVNVPLALIALLGGAIFLAESRAENAPRIDVLGAVISIVALFALVYALIEAGLRGWTDNSVLLSFVAAAALLALFVWWENCHAQPMLPLHYFKNRAFTGASLAMLLISFSLLGECFS